MANVLSDDKRQQVEALGRLGWTLRRIQRETGVRRETASDYLRAAGIAIRGRGGSPPKPATSAEVITDLDSCDQIVVDHQRIDQILECIDARAKTVWRRAGLSNVCHASGATEIH
jgi:hypothetical protein